MATSRRPQGTRSSSLSSTSHSIRKAKPRIRIIHLLEPEIIETDPANFRQLVQSLTGKPLCLKPLKKKEEDYPLTIERATKASIKEEEIEGMWVHEESLSSSGLLGEFVELEGLIQDFFESSEAPSSGRRLHDDLFGESPLSG